MTSPHSTDGLSRGRAGSRALLAAVIEHTKFIPFKSIAELGLMNLYAGWRRFHLTALSR